jgi:hypothetical protein
MQGDDVLKGFAPQTPTATMNELPVALYGAHNSPRIVAQRGVFTIFGKRQTPMEQLIDKDIIPPNALKAVVIAPRLVASIRQSLLDQGITESVVFPDLDGLARETKRFFGFED